ncbi:hypothetical protein TPE_1141 [Treponema pedis str. T A4]|uniref:Uncharacterized protein n=1 Tax=Treponema pedis str. T A4 TaxID=1291379 RepID=S5ZM31_9SPIR|nr:hypothetical protein TPE_1141 [Treponema pedis str. T A4]
MFIPLSTNLVNTFSYIFLEFTSAENNTRLRTLSCRYKPANLSFL